MKRAARVTKTFTFKGGMVSDTLEGSNVSTREKHTRGERGRGWVCVLGCARVRVRACGGVCECVKMRVEKQPVAPQ